MERYQQRLIANPSDKDAQEMLDYLIEFNNVNLDKENDPEWQKNNMEYDMRTSKVMVEKARNSEAYAQNLYAAMCNNEFIKNETWPLLTEETWSASWRSAGGIVSNMVGKGDYIDWYCSGIRADWSDEQYYNASKEEQDLYTWMKTNYVNEGFITDEIKQDLFNIGWLPHSGDFKNSI
jgi:hypothetical protein